LVIEVIRALSKEEQSQKLFGIDDAILIPAAVSIITAAINTATKGINPPPEGFPRYLPWAGASI
jgi:hypothetical protein